MSALNKRIKKLKRNYDSLNNKINKLSVDLCLLDNSSTLIRKDDEFRDAIKGVNDLRLHSHDLMYEFEFTSRPGHIWDDIESKQKSRLQCIILIENNMVHLNSQYTKFQRQFKENKERWLKEEKEAMKFWLGLGITIVVLLLILYYFGI